MQVLPDSRMFRIIQNLSIIKVRACESVKPVHHKYYISQLCVCGEASVGNKFSAGRVLH